jgi:hypothetical protein
MPAPVDLSGKRSGRCGRPFRKTEARAAHKAKERITDGGEEWLAPRVAARYAGVSRTTLGKWRDRPQRRGRPRRPGRCPPLGRAIRTRPFPGGYNRTITYFAKADLDEWRDAMARAKPVPDRPGLVYIKDAAAELGVSVRTLRRMPGVRVERLPGKSSDARARPRAYVSRSFVDAWKEQRAQFPVPAGKLSVSEAAKRLKVTRAELHNLIKAGLIDAEDGRSITTAEKGALVLRYPRSCKLIPLDAVERLKAAMAALPAGAGAVVHPGRGKGPGLLRRAAVALRNESVRVPELLGSIGTGSGPRRRGRPKGTIDAAAQDRNRRMVEEYKAGRYESVADLARAYHMTRGRASQILAAAGVRER